MARELRSASAQPGASAALARGDMGVSAVPARSTRYTRGSRGSGSLGSAPTPFVATSFLNSPLCA
eukprot:14999176-Alexandrium_andersonii.AAC.1